MADTWQARLALWMVIGALAMVGGWRAAAQVQPHRPSIHDCEPWMADALPGIGPKTAERMAAAIRAGELNRLPASAQAAARNIFVDWPE